MDHPVPPITILGRSVAVITLPFFYSEDLVPPVGLDLSCSSSRGEISDEDTITWLEVSAEHFLVVVGFSTGCSFICISGSNLVGLLHFLLPVTHIVLVTSMDIVSFNVE